MIARLTIRNQSNSTYTLIDTKDLRGTDGTTAGGSGGANIVTSFSDSQFEVYNNVDPTKLVAFAASGITAGNTRTITMPDANVNLGDISTNNDKVTNVSTDLSLGTINGTTMVVESSDGDNVTLIAADTDDAGLMTATQFDTLAAHETKLTTFPCEIAFAVSDETTDLETGTAVITFRAPWAFTLTGVRANVNTAPTGADLEIDINEAGATVLTTKLVIDDGDKTSVGSDTDPVIGGAGPAIADDAEITIDIDTIGSGAAGKGLKVTLFGTRSV